MLIFGLTHAGVAKDAVTKIVTGVRRSLALPGEPDAVVNLKADFSAAVKEFQDGPSVDRSGADSRSRETRQTSSGAKSS